MPSNFKAIVYGKDGKQKAKYVGGTSSQLLIDASLLGHQPGKQRYQLRQDYGSMPMLWMQGDKAGLYLLPRPAVCRVFHELEFWLVPAEATSCRFHLPASNLPNVHPKPSGKAGRLFCAVVLAKYLNFSLNFQQFCILCTPAFSDTIDSWKRMGAQRQGPPRCLCFRSKRPWAVV